jgi:hypothetical protein
MVRTPETEARVEADKVAMRDMLAAADLHANPNRRRFTRALGGNG